MGKVNCYQQRFKTPEERFWERVNKIPGGCWIRGGARKGKGYAGFWVDGKTVLAHRYAYMLLVGPIPEGHTIDHVKANGCTSKACVKAIADKYGPAHLEPVTCRENLMRGDTLQAANVAKTHCLRGHPLSGSNLKIDSRGMRQCRECRRGDELRHRAKDPEAYLRRKAAAARRRRQR
jgi:hypothetical protein